MTQTTDPSGGPHHKGHFKGAGLDSFYETLRKPGLVRPSSNRWFAGVASGIAYRLGVDPLVVRAGFILFGLFFGTGIALYLVLWLLMQDERGRLPIEQALKHGEGGPIFLLVVAALAVLGGVPWDGDLHGPRLGGMIVLGVLGYLFVTRTASGRQLYESVRDGVRTSAPDAQGAAPTTSATGVSSGVSTGNAAANAGATAGPTAGAPPAWTASPPSWVSAAPPRVRSKVVGFAPGMLILGFALVAAAIVGHLANIGDWRGSHTSVGIAAGLGVLGLGIVVVGMLGRRSGWLAPIALIGVASSVALSVFPSGVTNPWQVGERTYKVTQLTGTNAYELGVGEIILDLSKAEHAATTGEDKVTVILGVGELKIAVPRDTHVVVNAKAKAGEIKVSGSSSADLVTHDGTSLKHTYEFGPTSAPVAMTVDAEIGLGQITMTTESKP